MRSSRLQNTKPQDDAFFIRSYIFRTNHHATFLPTNENENPRFDMPWHVAILDEDRTQYIVSLHFLILLKGLDLSYPQVFRIEPHAAFAAPDDNENKLPPHPGPLPPRGEGKKNKRIQSSFSLDGRR
ncbi:hypothetical protein RT761_02660 [Atribacter laminatus]|jgi:hypothetical protein|uniref:Uncharacterized protein n=1 Tax=Atribacter laminatus TaxID=2847778 RepID=A0A7T1AP06_ATRLM|nr:hypothetical protein RT761_02660 [Atribacter laminatus]